MNGWRVRLVIQTQSESRGRNHKEKDAGEGGKGWGQSFNCSLGMAPLRPFSEKTS